MRPTLSVGAIVLRGDEVLLVRRGRAPMAGRWSFPGGRVRSGERLREACGRELWEETGLRVRLGPIVGVYEHIDEGQHHVIVDFLAVASARATARAASDAAAAAWVKIPAVGRLQTTPGLRRALRTALRARAARAGKISPER